MTSEHPPFPDYYEVLGIRPEASDAELHRARREAVKRWHPDRNSAPEAEGMMRLVNAAWEVLGTPETRSEYDAVYFSWKAAEYARRADAAGGTRRENVRGRERDARRSSSGEVSNRQRHSGCCCWFIVIAAIVVAVGWGIWDRIESETAPTEGTIRSTIGDGSIQCVPAFRADREVFWASVNFPTPTSSSWSVGFLYHNADSLSVRGLDLDAATYIYKTVSGGPSSGHWTRQDDVVKHRVGPDPLRPPSALKTSGDNTLGIEVNERGSYLILNGEQQIHIPVEQLNPVSSRVRFCVGFFSSEVSEYTLRYSGLTGGAR